MRGITVEIKWAFIFTAAGLLWALLEKLLGFHDKNISGQVVFTNIFFIPAVLIYWFALKEKRARLNGDISFKQAFISGLIITAVVALLVPLQQVITHRLISPDYFYNVRAHTVSEGQMNKEQAEAYFNLQNYIIQSMIFAPIAGIITSAVVAFFISRKKSA